MSEIQQLYCTHCTHGSSALERKTGALAQRMLGYSVRAGSLEAVDLRRYYRQIESYVYYYLPRDTSAEAKVTLTAETAPRRLLYLPAAGDLQMLCQACYRPFDTEGRPGSYFAHVLAADRREEASAWSPVEALRLWRAPGWVIGDSSELGFLLPSLRALDELLIGRRPAVDDAVLRSFLLTPAGGAFDDPRRVIPPRWRKRPPSERQALLIDVLSLLLEIDVLRHESLLLIAEPDLAALVFYGALRLLPVLPWTRAIGFSTFEPNPERLCTTLAATHFADPTADLRAEAYRGNVPVLNTFTNQRSPRRRNAGRYAPQMVARLVEPGWLAVQQTLDDFSRAAPASAADLEVLALLSQALDHGLTAALPPDWREYPVARTFLRRAVGRQLAGLAGDTEKLKALSAGPNPLDLIELCAEPAEFPAARGAAEYLLRNLPDELLGRLLRSAPVAAVDKAAVVARTLATRGDLPEGCEPLWEEALAAATAADGPQPSLLAQALLSPPLKTIDTFYQQTLPEHRPALVLALVAASRQKPTRQAALGHVLGKMSRSAFTTLLLSHGEILLAHYPGDEPTLGLRLQELVRQLPEPIAELPRLLPLLQSARQRLPDTADQERLEHWQTCFTAIARVGTLQDQRRGVWRQAPAAALEEACQGLAEAAAGAMSGEEFAEDFSAATRAGHLRQVGLLLLPGRGLLPGRSQLHRAMWRKIAWQFKHNSWPRVPWRRMGEEGKTVVPVTWIAGIVAAALLLTLAVVGVWLLENREPADIPPEPPAVAQPTPPAAAPTASTAEQAAAELDARRRAAAEEEQRRRALAQSESDQQTQLRAAADKQAQADWLAQQKGGATPPKPAPEAAPPAAAAKPPTPPPPAPVEAKTPKPPEPMPAAPVEAKPAQAKPPAALEPQPATPAPARPTIEPFESWRSRMQELAKKSGGILLERVQVVDGLATPEALQAIPMPGLALGAGRVEGGNRSYDFGAQYQHEPIVTRQGVPVLAAEMGLTSVTVALRRLGENGTRIAIELKPRQLPDDACAELRTESEKLTKRRQKLMGLLSTKLPTDDAQTTWNQAVLELLGLKLPPIPEEPPLEGLGDRDNEKRLKARDAYLLERRAAEQKRAEMLGQLRGLAQQEAGRLNIQLKQLQEQIKSREGDIARQNEQVRRRVFERSAVLSAIVYRVRGNLDVPPAAPEGGAPDASAPFGHFTIGSEAVPDLPEAVQARLRARLVDPTGAPLAPDRGAAAPFVADCLVHLRSPQGVARMKRSGGVARFEPVNIESDFSTVEFEFVFYQNGQGVAPKSQELFRSPRMALEQMKPNHEYTVTLQLTAAELERLGGSTAPRRTKVF